jgi:hypothetical protein
MQAANDADDAGLVGAQVGEGDVVVDGRRRRSFRAKRGQKLLIHRAGKGQGVGVNGRCRKRL